jgi:hypothetical protein
MIAIQFLEKVCASSIYYLSNSTPLLIKYKILPYDEIFSFIVSEYSKVIP